MQIPLDIISNKGDFLTRIKKTLVELVRKTLFASKKRKKIKSSTKKYFSANKRKKIKSSTIKSLNSNKRKRQKSSSGFSISSLVINSSINEVKEDKNDKKEELEEEVSEEILETEEEVIVNGGYGTVSTAYENAPVVKYTDYGKIFKYLGSFKTKNSYDSFNFENIRKEGSAMNESTREMVSLETMEKAAKHFKYFVRGEIIGDVGFVPPFGSNIDSKEWEKYRLMSQMSIYAPLLKLKMTMA